MGSVTRSLMEQLRCKLGAARPLSAPPTPKPVAAHTGQTAHFGAQPAPKPRACPTAAKPTAAGFAERAKAHTTALVGIGAVGTRYATDVVLQFQAELAVAHEAVAAVLPEGWAEQHGLLALRSRVRDHREFLLRPDLGRRLDEESIALLRARAAKNIDVQPILADGLSAIACMGSGMALLEAYSAACKDAGLNVGTPMCAQFARVWLEDEIGETVGAKVAAILLGERPGLGTGDGLSAYLVYQPRVGKTDGDRNMMSNIHARGTPPEQAGKRLAILTRAMIDQSTSGVDLDLSALKDQLGDAGGQGYRAPQTRQRLVEVP
jgi:ethanolamine ammonia-lyase small subunit